MRLDPKNTDCTMGGVSLSHPEVVIEFSTTRPAMHTSPPPTLRGIIRVAHEMAVPAGFRRMKFVNT